MAPAAFPLELAKCLKRQSLLFLQESRQWMGEGDRKNVQLLPLRQKRFNKSVRGGWPLLPGRELPPRPLANVAPLLSLPLRRLYV